MLERPTSVDSEVAAVTFNDHLDMLWTNGIAAENGWGRIPLDPIHSIITMWATKPNDEKEHYFIRLGGEYYDRWPPTVSFVDPDEWKPIDKPCRWWPAINFPEWFRLHLNHPHVGGQLVCFSFSAEYYMTPHTPSEAAVWTPGKHSLSATLTKLQEVLGKQYYQGRSA
jgi:hypothetical protein